ncbi:MAG: hypothetical protein EPN70_22300 [Paraburkholderia sp.]|uniref:hypothetical protein n=1 Tax=Paraburkholderia sp. TaxID=1926495 RepID=UPI0011F9955C|nr:hypothetical protein [Paraburkholderia sp.]TAM00455.1 MAG: hypothetical protein EPN70_22300 [Paraburkholderia sp.]TAM31390.1 MAG: hypothetical protein EPN59_05520 [Paraburkholderia sp.]
MKYVCVIFVVATLDACASQPLPMSAESVGTSLHPSVAVAQCIAQKWADRSQQQVISQTMTADNQAIDVYMPGQRPPDGAAATVRPSWSPNNKTWVGYRAGSGANVANGRDATSAITACL